MVNKYATIPDLNTNEMKQYALQQLIKAPLRIQKLLSALSSSNIDGIKMNNISTLYLTQQQRDIFDNEGFLTISNIISLQLIDELKKYISLKLQSENMFSEYSYLTFHGPKYNIGLVTKYGWTKIDYLGPIQQILSSIPGIYRVACEYLGTNRLLANGYEYKVCHPREENGSEFEFVHAGNCNFLKLNLII